ncbi:aspartate kinase [Pseudenhygromyxa sp. WMMC2535]|uniref:aspartate kinase n=1 Tax=Pseudenhygromyxa sp. WMMC2535 TaxID=2712867 RepID=UPI0015553D60|nr:aspartate kinase [Pseudenhygromyxa sp. WMMC2535]NVB38974.1 aspartate kinase [Pseudenhygromyxa sp. WMMC2535]
MPTPIVVHKYGGSSVATVDKIRAVARRVIAAREQGLRVVVVVSAMGKTTDELLAKAKELSGSPSRRELDMLLSCGERASMALLSIAIQELGHDAVSLTGSQSGIMTNSRHSGARIIDVRPYRVQDELEDGKIVVVAGFQGVSYKREVTTLGRGGSDTTAVALAGALGAEYCEICSDVDGVYTADPRVVDAATLLQAISHDELLELTSHGAKVLHAESVEFARRSGVALWARATAGEAEGTRIDRPEQVDNAHPITGVSGVRDLVRLRARVNKSMDHMLSVAADASLPVLHLDADHEIADLWFSPADVPDWTAVREKLIGQVEIEERCGAVSIVGDFFGRNAAKLARARSVAAGAGIAIKAMATSPLRATLFCAQDDVDALTRALHRAFREV